MNFDFAQSLIILVILILCITVHELAHAIAADALGDDTPRLQGRITAAPWAHFDPLGAIMIVVTTLSGFGIGWGKPVQTNPANFTVNPRLGMAIVAFAGPLSNIIMAVGGAMALRFGLFGHGETQIVGGLFVLINISLALFNLLPIYPLDGSHLLTSALPTNLAFKYQQFARQYGVILFLGLALTGVLGRIIGPARDAILAFLVGPLSL